MNRDDFPDARAFVANGAMAPWHHHWTWRLLPVWKRSCPVPGADWREDWL